MSRGQNGTNATVRDVARVARVSTATVSRALRFPDVVRPETRARIARAVERLNYVPHGVARALSTRRTDSVGAVIPTLDNAIYAVSTHSLQKVLNDAGYALVLACHEFDLAAEARWRARSSRRASTPWCSSARRTTARRGASSARSRSPTSSPGRSTARARIRASGSTTARPGARSPIICSVSDTGASR